MAIWLHFRLIFCFRKTKNSFQLVVLFERAHFLFGPADMPTQILLRYCLVKANAQGTSRSLFSKIHGFSFFNLSEIELKIQTFL